MNPIAFLESNIRFIFDGNQWSHLLKYDEQTDYKKIGNAITGTKAVDFIGILNNEILTLIEVKNFRGFRIENKSRTDLKEDSLDLEVAQKVRDTLSGILGAARHSTHLKEQWNEYVKFILNNHKSVHVILWLEEDLPPQPNFILQKRMKSRDGNLTNTLKQKLNWLTSHVSVVNASYFPYSSSLTVSLLPKTVK